MSHFDISPKFPQFAVPNPLNPMNYLVRSSLQPVLFASQRATCDFANLSHFRARRYSRRWFRHVHTSSLRSQGQTPNSFVSSATPSHPHKARLARLPTGAPLGVRYDEHGQRTGGLLEGPPGRQSRPTHALASTPPEVSTVCYLVHTLLSNRADSSSKDVRLAEAHCRDTPPSSG